MKWLRTAFLLLVFISVLLRDKRLSIHREHWTPRSNSPLSTLGDSRALHDALPEVISHPKEFPSGALPRRDLTPGKIDSRVTQQNIESTICHPGYSASVRAPFKYTNAMKHRVMRAYGETGSIHDYELDHLIPLGLGGCPDCEGNLWPQPRNKHPGAQEKDQVEDYLRRQVCSGAMSLAEAQEEIASNWYALYERIRGHANSAPGKRE